MSLNISGIFNPNAHALSQQTSQTVQANADGSAASQAGGKETINLSIGSTISGTVEETDKNMVSIRLSNGQTVLAKLEESFAFGKGSNVIFSVSGVSDGQYILKSLFQNTAMQATGEKALLQAGIAVNDNSLGMVSEMMEDGMSIDKNSLQTMYKEVAAHPQASGANIVAMNRLQIPITNANIAQFQAYMNLEHRISAGIAEFSNSLMDSYEQLSLSKDGALGNLMKQVLDQFGEALDAPELAQMRLSVNPEAEVQTQNIQQAENMQQAENPGAVIGAEQTDDKNLIMLKQLMQFENVEGETEQTGQGVVGNEEISAKDMPVSDFHNTLRSLGMNEETLEKLQQGNISDKEMVGFAKALLDEAVSNEDGNLMNEIHKLFDSKEFQSALKNEMSRQLLLTPEHLAQKEDVESYYKNLNEQLGKLAKSLSQFLPQDSQPMQQLHSMQDNLQFMEHMNQTMSYIQLPMKLLSDQAHGDLYVYTNKKNMAQSDGTVSAYLHLDMDHLGPVDVYVAMQDKKVSTNFYLKDDEMIDFIAQRIDQLNERLEKKGYQMTANITKKEKETSVMQEIIEDHKEMHMISTRSFDVRA